MDSDQYLLHQSIEENHWWFTARKQIVLTLLSDIAPPRGDVSIIDIGCGTGGLLSELENQYKTIGIDKSSTAVAIARHSTIKSKIICSDNPESLPERHSGEMRVWLFLDVLEHIKNDASFFATFTKHIFPGDTVIITVPANPKQFSPHDEAFGHYRRYDPSSFRSLWENMPYKLCLLSYYNSRLYWPITVIRLINRIRNKSAGLVGTDFKMSPFWLNKILHSIFCGESKRLLNMINQGKSYRHGISLIAVLKKHAN